jgi:hypothetical protein
MTNEIRLASWLTACILLFPFGVHAAATVTVINGDLPNVGFNDPTAVAPVGGNAGTTLGQQRLNVVIAAANKWAATLTSSVPITIRGAWVAQSCTANSAVLAAAGTQTIWRNFLHAPLPNRWYPAALANKISGTDLDPTTADIVANFNVNLGQSGCLTGSFFYLGLDNNHGNNPDLFTVLLHELGHGLGFQNFTSGDTGNFIAGFPSIWDDFLFDNSTNKTWIQMTPLERVLSAVNTGHLVWAGINVHAAVPQVLQPSGGSFVGTDSIGRPLMYAPGTIQPGSSVSHFDISLSPNQLMEPNLNPSLTHEVTTPLDLTLALLMDIGWDTPDAAAPVRQSDFNGDGKSDILWRNTNGTVAAWIMNGLVVAQSGGFGAIAGDWSVSGIGDFNGDGKSDILWRNTNGTVAAWIMNGLAVAQSGGFGTIPSDWSVAGVGDLNGDGRSDILWRHTNGTVAAWIMNGLAVAQAGGFGTIAGDWSVSGIGDFNGDGNSDILWRNTNGTVAAWIMNGLGISQTGGFGTIAGDWSVHGVGDFNGDGKSDILWRNTNGAVAAWIMNGLGVSQTGGFGIIASDWSVGGTGDLNGDGKSDILWRNTNGAVAAWIMNGLGVLQTGGLGSISTDWSIQGSR